MYDEPPTSAEPEPADAEDESREGEPAEEALAITPTLTQPLLAYLIDGDLPEDKNKAQHIVCRSKAYTVIQGELYKSSVIGIFQ